MMKKLILFIAATAALISCSNYPKGSCVINGTIDDPDNRDGAWIFLVPQGPHEPAEVDSVLIENGKFTFVTDRERMGIIRVTMYRRLGLQDLLVVTEPGEINVTISSSSRCGGTPQNDSLQVWKELTMEMNAATSNLYQMGMKAQADSLRAIYKERSRQLCENVGSETTLGAFLLKMFPPRHQEQTRRI